jgi:hypothetical protein
VHASELLDDYWPSVLPSSLRSDAEWLQITVYACQQSLSVRGACDLVVRCVRVSPWSRGFRQRFRELLDAIAGLSEARRLDALLAAVDDWDLDEVPCAAGAHGSPRRLRLLWQAYVARSYLGLRAYALPTKDLRFRHESYVISSPPILDHALSTIRGLAVLLVPEGHEVHVAAPHLDRVLRPSETWSTALSALGCVPPRLLLERTPLGAVDGLLRRVMSYYSSDVLVLAPESALRSLAPWPRGTSLLTPRTDVLAVQELAESAGGVARVYFFAAAGTLAPLLLRLGMEGR